MTTTDWVAERLIRMHYTGVSYDPITNDWQCWLEGKSLGWADTRIEAQDRVNDALLRRKPTCIEGR